MSPSDPWSDPSTVEGFASGAPNPTLMAFARSELRRARGMDSGADLHGPPLVLDIGCGAGRNAVPLAALGWQVLGIDLSTPMLIAARERAEAEGVGLSVARASMRSLPVADASCDLVVAHGIWNLAQSDVELRQGIGEAARVAKPGAALFVFTFANPALVPALDAAGFRPDPSLPLRHVNAPPPGKRLLAGPPPIHEGLFRRRP